MTGRKNMDTREFDGDRQGERDKNYLFCDEHIFLRLHKAASHNKERSIGWSPVRDLRERERGNRILKKID